MFSEEIIKLLDDLGKRFGIVIDWSNNNIIPYIQELMARFIKYKNACAIIWIIVSLIIILISLIIFIKKFKYIKKEKLDSYDAPFSWFVLMSSCIINVIFLISLICNIFGLAKNIYLPELVTIEYIQTYIENTKNN